MPDDLRPHSTPFDAGEAGSGNGHGRDRSPTGSERQEMEELRRIILGAEADHIADLQARLDLIATLHEKGQIEAMSRELPEAIQLHNEDPTRLSNALGTTIEKTLHVSIRRNPQPFVDAIFPVIGPAIRRSIKEALKSVVESMNRTLEHSLSIRSLKWRMEAARTGTSFSEVVLAHTLSYRVEQLFLIDRASGIPIHHVIADTVEARDGDVVSGMLSAIQDFVRDSLGGRREDVLGSLEFGDMEVLVEPGPKAILAAVVRGIPTMELRETLKEIIEAVHLQYSHLLDAFDGESDSCAPMLPLLRSGLLSQYREKEGRSIGRLLAGGLVVLALIVWMAMSFVNYLRWDDYVSALKSEPGIIVTNTGREGGRWVVEGLRDPLSRDPADLAPESLPPDRIVGKWRSYMALDAEMVTRRAARYLQAPSSVTFRYSGDTLYAEGEAHPLWIQQARTRISYLPGISSYDERGLVSRRTVIDDEIERIEQTLFFFPSGEAALDAGQLPRLDSLAASIRSLRTAGESEGLSFQIQVNGFASSEGSETTNRVLTRQRAETVRDALVQRGIPDDLFVPVGTGRERIGDGGASEAIRAANRSVSFEVVY